MYQGNSDCKLQEFIAHATEVTCMTFGSKSFQLMATGGEDCRVNIWKVGSTSNLWTLDKNKSAIQSLCFDNDEQCIVSGNKSGSIKIYDLNEGRLARNLLGHKVGISCLQYHAFGEFIVSGSMDCTMKVWDIRNKTCLQTYSGHDKPVTCVRFSPDGRWVASSSEDGSLHIWDLVAGKLLNSFHVKPGYITSFDFNPVEFMMSAATSVRTVKIWDLDLMKPAYSIPADSSPVRAIYHTQYRDSALCTATKDSIKLWSLDASMGTGKLLGSKDVPWDRLGDLKINSQNNHVIGGSFISNFVSIFSFNLEDIFTPKINRASAGVGNREAASRPVPGSSPVSTNNHISNNNSNSNNNSSGSSYSSNNNNNNNQARPLSEYIEYKKEPDSKSAAPRRNASPPVIVADYKAEDKAARDIDPNSRNINSSNSSSIGYNNRARVAESKLSINSINPSKHPDKQTNDFSVTDSSLPPYQSDGDEVDGHGYGGWGQDNLSMVEEDSDEDHLFEERPKGAGTAGGVDNLAGSGGLAPQVIWESDNAAKEMATSMGESFWKRFQESQRTANLIKADQAKSSAATDVDNDNDEDDSFEDSELAAKLEALGGEIAGLGIAGAKIGGLNQDYSGIAALLPSSKFDGPGSDVSTPRQAAGESPSASERQYRPKDLNQLRSQQPRKAVPKPMSGGSGSGSEASINVNALEVVGSKQGEVALRHCYSMLDRLITSSPDFNFSIQNRLTSLKILRRDWDRGLVMETINYLLDIARTLSTEPKQVVILADFLSSIRLKGQAITLDCCVQLMPILESMLFINDGWLSLKVSLTAMETFLILLESFGDLIRQAKAAMGISNAGVDFSREERIRKCEVCNEVLQRLRPRLDSIKSHHQNPRITEAVHSLHTRLE